MLKKKSWSLQKSLLLLKLRCRNARRRDLHNSDWTKTHAKRKEMFPAENITRRGEFSSDPLLMACRGRSPSGRFINGQAVIFDIFKYRAPFSREISSIKLHEIYYTKSCKQKPARLVKVNQKKLRLN